MSNEKKYSCIKPNMVTCDLRNNGSSRNNCSNCLDVTVAHAFLIKHLKHPTGDIRRGIINLDAVPGIMTLFYESMTNNKPTA